MKKLVYMAAFCAAFALASCGGNKTTEAPEAADSAAVTGESAEEIAANLADAAVADFEAAISGSEADASKVKEVTEKIQSEITKLQEAGDAEAAAAYASKVKAFLEKNADKLKSVDATSTTLTDLVNAAASLPENVTNTAEEGADAVKADTKAAVEAAKEAGKEAATTAVENAKAKANEKANEAVETANKKADEAIQKGAEKASNAISKGLNSLTKK